VSPWVKHLLRVIAVAVGAFVLYYTLDHFEVAWAIWPIAAVLGLIVGGELFLQSRRRKKRESDWDRWERAVYDAAARPTAIREVREQLAKTRRLGGRLKLDVAHLSVILAELLDASGKPLEGARVLAQVPVEELDKTQAAVVRHAKIVCYLSAGDIENAESALSVRDGANVASDVDERLDLLGFMVAIEKGDAQAALEGAAKLEKAEDPDVVLESVVVQAAAKDALGDRDGAIALLDRIDEETLESLAVLGQPRIRPLAKAALDAGARTASESAS
jgi:hypothetical protein